jgi:hypothetical protein
MHAPYRALHQRPTVPDMPVDPPEPSNEEYDRIYRNSCRIDAINSIRSLECALVELSDEHGLGYQNTLKTLADLRDYLERDLED